MVKCVHCGSTDMELWGLAGFLKDVKADGASLVCKSCGTMQPDSVLRELLRQKMERLQQSQPAAQEQEEAQTQQPAHTETISQQPEQSSQQQSQEQSAQQQ